MLAPLFDKNVMVAFTHAFSLAQVIEQRSVQVMLEWAQEYVSVILLGARKTNVVERLCVVGNLGN